ncbi:D-inositol-3-phosphate glycosyltransferase [Paraburkholderia ultramafica]|uniref:D-inositol-3-phosphate glycosyltransferase n=1 Tax=Paraburkholderia ultramafica TaxID=1544867 RepID=A0A6S7CBP4_9BURK|nr:glycosyltransferase family 1 protein [Paraburkholderia ultramafica]CAB3776366.1 D-inositol-3-phosphate glycosyltransferase [Paraburkholderia ultramafica]
MAFAISGKFTWQPMAGVQRVAYELTRAMQMRATPGEELEIFVPRNAIEPGASLKRQRQFSWLRGTLWEQITLPFAARGRTLLSLCNTNPTIKRRHVVMVHDMAVYDVPQGFSKEFRLWYRIIFSMFPKSNPTILTVSEYSKQWICHHLNVDESRVEVVPPGADHLDRVVADPGITQRLGLTKDAYCVIVGSLHPRKNLQRVLEAITQLQHLTNIRFVVVGRKNSRIFNDGLVSQFADSKQVKWSGFVSDGDQKALHENAGRLIFPSLYEGFGLPPLEAMYCGCPVIASSRTAIPGVCADAALYCDATSAADIAEKVSCLRTDEGLREHYRAKGAARAREFKWERSVQRLLDDILYGRSSDRVTELAPSASMV